MAVHIERMTSEVTAMTAEMPLTEAQVEALVKLVMKRMAEQQVGQAAMREATRLAPGVARLSPFGN